MYVVLVIIHFRPAGWAVLVAGLRACTAHVRMHVPRLHVARTYVRWRDHVTSDTRTRCASVRTARRALATRPALGQGWGCRSRTTSYAPFSSNFNGSGSSSWRLGEVGDQQWYSLLPQVGSLQYTNCNMISTMLCLQSQWRLNAVGTSTLVSLAFWRIWRGQPLQVCYLQNCNETKRSTEKDSLWDQHQMIVLRFNDHALHSTPPSEHC